MTVMIDEDPALPEELSPDEELQIAKLDAAEAAKPLCLENSPFENRGAQLLHAAWIDGWASCRDAEFIGEEAMNDAFNGSLTLAMCLAADHAK